MFRTQLRFQKILSLGTLIFSAIVLVYSLGLMTDIYGAFYFAYDPELNREYVTGAKIFYEMQDFNTQMLLCAVGLILVSLTLFMTGINSRRKYYIGNYISTGLVSVSNVAVAVFTTINVSLYRTKFLNEVDFEQLKAFVETSTTTIYTESTFWFDAGYVLSALMLVIAGLLIFNLIWKIKLMNKEQSLLSNKEVVAQ